MLILFHHFGMDVKERRVERLKQFVQDSGGAAKLARDFEGIDASYISQLINKHRPFGEKSARKIETLCRLPAYYFDRNEIRQDPAKYVVDELFQQMDEDTRRKWVAIGQTLVDIKDEKSTEDLEIKKPERAEPKTAMQ